MPRWNDQNRTGACFTRTLTGIEEEVLFAILRGEKFTAFARRRSLKAYTVHNAAARVYDKLGASNRVEAMRMAITREVLSSRYGYWGA